MNFKQIGQKYRACGQNFMYGFVRYDFSLHLSLQNSHFLNVTCGKLQYFFSSHRSRNMAREKNYVRP
jgi:hypothetical protein